MYSFTSFCASVRHSLPFASIGMLSNDKCKLGLGFEGTTSSVIWHVILLCGMVCLRYGRKSNRTVEKSLVNIVSCLIDLIHFLKFCCFLCYISSNVYILYNIILEYMHEYLSEG